MSVICITFAQYVERLAVKERVTAEDVTEDTETEQGLPEERAEAEPEPSEGESIPVEESPVVGEILPAEEMPVELEKPIEPVEPVEPVEPELHIVLVEQELPTEYGDITIYTAGGVPAGTLFGYNTVYRDEGQTVYLSNDGSIYIKKV